LRPASWNEINLQQCNAHANPLAAKDELKTAQTGLYEGPGRQSGRLASLMLSALGHGVQRVGIQRCGALIVGLYFPSLTSATTLAAVLPIAVCVAREHSRFLVKTK